MTSFGGRKMSKRHGTKFSAMTSSVLEEPTLTQLLVKMFPSSKFISLCSGRLAADYKSGKLPVGRRDVRWFAFPSKIYVFRKPWEKYKDLLRRR
jgi:hypothetical protein